MLRTIMLLIILLCAVLSGYGQNEIIIENVKGGKNSDQYSEVSGTWSDSVAKSIAQDLTPNLGTRFTSIGNEGIAEARFTPEIPEDGNYEVFIIFPRQGNSMQVIYKIHSEGGDAEIKKLHDGWGAKSAKSYDTWTSLGIYKFKKGKEGYVSVIKPEGTIEPPDPRNAGRIYADSAKFVKTTAELKKSPDDNIPQSASAPAAPQSDPSKPPDTASAPNAPSQPQPAPSDSAAVQWVNNLQDAKVNAKVQNKNILLYFFSQDSSNCTKYDKEVLNSSNIVTKLNSSFVCVLIDFGKNYEFSMNLGVFKSPAFILYDSAGNPLTKIDGFKNKDEFYQIITAY